VAINWPVHHLSIIIAARNSGRPGGYGLLPTPAIIIIIIVIIANNNPRAASLPSGVTCCCSASFHTQV
jgi:hypothetical protein